MNIGKTNPLKPKKMNKAEKNYTEDFFNHIDWTPKKKLSTLELRQLMLGFQKYLFDISDQENKELREELNNYKQSYEGSERWRKLMQSRTEELKKAIKDFLMDKGRSGLESQILKLEQALKTKEHE